MNYEQTIEYLYARLPMFSRVGAAALKPDLGNTITLCAFLGNPQNNYKTIHIAGTNGKGSVSHFLASILQESGYKTGLYTSPHLYDFRERIRINGEMIPEYNVVEFTQRIKHKIEEIEPSFFEVTVAMAFDHFAKSDVEVAIIETGLGGRLDSTNIINPVLSIITNIGLDHTQLLGDSLEKIAYEKAGIIKKNVPVVIGRSQVETEAVFNKMAIASSSKIIQADKLFQGKFLQQNNYTSSFEIKNIDAHANLNIESDLNGSYQAENISTILACIPELIKHGFKIKNENVLNGFRFAKANTKLLGRWEIIKLNPTVILDVGHNADGIRKILENLSFIKYGKVHFILGLSKDKDIDSVIGLLPAFAKYSFTQAHLPRALEADKLKTIADQFKLKGNVFDSVNQALEDALRQAEKDDVIIVCGSVFVIAEIDRKKFSQ